MVLPILWALLAILALALGWTSGVQAFFWIGYLMLALWLVGAISGRLASRGLRAARRLSLDRIPYGAAVTVEVTVENRSHLPILWLVAAEALPAGLPMTGLRGRVGPLSPSSSFSFRYTVQGARRGYYELGPTILRIGDLFGLSIREVEAAGAEALTVFPKIVPITRARLPSRRPAGEIRARHRVLEDPTQIIGIRPYQRGDGLRRVHWRATAHTGRLQSKLFEVSAQVDNILVLDLQHADYPGGPAEAEETAELAVITAASLAHYLIDSRQRTGLVVLGRDPIGNEKSAIRLPPGRDRRHLAGILSILGRVQLGRGQDVRLYLEREKEEWSWGSMIVVIAPALTSELMASLISLRGAGFEVHLIQVGRGVRLANEIQAVRAFGASATAIRSESDISGIGI